MEECDQKQQEVVQHNLRSVFPSPRVHPWLMFIHGKKRRKQTFYSLSESCVHVKSIPNMHRKQYCGSYFGWMIFHQEHSEDCFLLNPISMKKIQLPPCGSFEFRCCLLSSPPDDPSCIVLFVENVGSGRASFWLCKPCDADWSYQNLEIGKDEEVYEAILRGRRIYAHVVTSLMSRLVNFYIEANNTIVMETQAIPITLPFPQGPSISFGLVESSGEIFLVTLLYWGSRVPLQHHIRDILIHKLNKNEWVKVDSIGNQAFFIDGLQGTSCSVKESRIPGNTVYISMPQDRCLYAFDLEEKSLTVTLPCPDVKENWTQPVWVWILPHL